MISTYWSHDPLLLVKWFTQWLHVLVTISLLTGHMIPSRWLHDPFLQVTIALFAGHMIPMCWVHDPFLMSFYADTMILSYWSHNPSMSKLWSLLIGHIGSGYLLLVALSFHEDTLKWSLFTSGIILPCWYHDPFLSVISLDPFISVAYSIHADTLWSLLNGLVIVNSWSSDPSRLFMYSLLQVVIIHMIPPYKLWNPFRVWGSVADSPLGLRLLQTTNLNI